MCGRGAKGWVDAAGAAHAAGPLAPAASCASWLAPAVPWAAPAPALPWWPCADPVYAPTRGRPGLGDADHGCRLPGGAYDAALACCLPTTTTTHLNPTSTHQSGTPPCPTPRRTRSASSRRPRPSWWWTLRCAPPTRVRPRLACPFLLFLLWKQVGAGGARPPVCSPPACTSSGRRARQRLAVTQASSETPTPLPHHHHNHRGG